MNAPGGPLIKDKHSSSSSNLNDLKQDNVASLPGEVELPEVEVTQGEDIKSEDVNEVKVDIEPEGDDGKTKFIQCCCKRIDNINSVNKIVCCLTVTIQIIFIAIVICCYVFINIELVKKRNICNSLKSNVEHIGVFGKENNHYFLKEYTGFKCIISMNNIDFLHGKRIGDLYKFYTPDKPTRCTLEAEHTDCKSNIVLFNLLYTFIGVVITAGIFSIFVGIFFYLFGICLRFRVVIYEDGKYYYYENIDGNNVVREKND
jgi:hypothetical protein